MQLRKSFVIMIWLCDKYTFYNFDIFWGIRYYKLCSIPEYFNNHNDSTATNGIEQLRSFISE